MDESVGITADEEEGDNIVDEPSIIHLLRVFIGAVHQPGMSSTACAIASRSPWQTQEEVGCTLWDLSITEVHASRMISAGLLPVTCAVLQHCTNSIAANLTADSGNDIGVTCNTEETSRTSRQVKSESVTHETDVLLLAQADSNESGQPPDVNPEPASGKVAAWDVRLKSSLPGQLESITTSAKHSVQSKLNVGANSLPNEDALRRVGVETQEGQTLGESGITAVCSDVGSKRGMVVMSAEEAQRLREITCGLLANACSHRNLRKQISLDAGLATEVLEILHTSDDPACLTELLRFLASAVGCLYGDGCGGGGGSGGSGAGARAKGGLGEGLVIKETLERLVFFLENSLEEKLRARACSLVYALMYRCEDEVICPLVRCFGLEQALASLLNTRANDLSFEQVGGAETGLDSLLRCLEVLSTSEVSFLGPSTADVPTRSNQKTSPGHQRNESRARRSRESAEEVRNGVIKGLVAALMPWEHSKSSQEAALLVLGNILDNGLECIPENVPGSATAGTGDTPPVQKEYASDAKQNALECNGALGKALVVLAAKRIEDGDDEDTGGFNYDRFKAKAEEFLDSVSSLSEQDGRASAQQDDDLRMQLREAARLVRRALSIGLP